MPKTKPEQFPYRYMVRLDWQLGNWLERYCAAVGGVNRAVVTRIALVEYRARQLQRRRHHGSAKREA